MKKRGFSAKKGGFILAYSVTVMTFVVMLITTAIGLLRSTVSLGNVSKNNFVSDYTFSQMEEYIRSGEYYKAEAETAGTGFYMEVVQNTDNTGAGIIEIFVYENGRARLYYKKRNERVISYVYGEKPPES